MQVKQGDRIKVHYTGRLDDGEVFDSSEGKQPLEFTIGERQVISGFEQAVIGMEINEQKTVTIAAKDAYGEQNEQLTHKVPRSKLPINIEPKPGMTLGLQDPQGRVFPIKIIAVDDDSITIDANHPLAGKTLHFTIKVVGIL